MVKKVPKKTHQIGTGDKQKDHRRGQALRKNLLKRKAQAEGRNKAK